MEFALTIVAIVSAATALVMTAIVVSMLRNERRRSDARVEALVRLAQADAPRRHCTGPCDSGSIIQGSGGSSEADCAPGGAGSERV